MKDHEKSGNRNFDEANTTFAGFEKLCANNTELCAEVRKVLNPSANASDNRLSSSDGYVFDPSGNTVRDPQSRRFTYDGENKQVKVETLDLNGEPVSTVGEYSYDGDGRRIKKHVPSTGEVTVFVYDAGGKLIGEYSTIAAPQAPKVSYTTADHLGSPRILTDQNGATISRRDFMPFGEEIARAGYGADAVRKQFTGYERDGETELDFAQARYLSSSLGRFSTPDHPLLDQIQEIPQSWNLYHYVRNNPLRFIDPTGTTTGDFYDREGNWLGTDEVGDKKIYLLGPGQVPNKDKPNVNWGGKLDDQTVAQLKGASIEVKGLIIYDRNEEGSDYTSGTFKTVGGGDTDVKGVMLEPAGPDTETRNQDKRVPAGLFDIEDYSSKKFPDNFRLSNEKVPKDRRILFHAGRTGADTEGCIMPGASITNGAITSGTTRPKMNELRTFIKSKGASNVKFIIRN